MQTTNLIMFGPPGAGKGTQAIRISKKFNLSHLSTGDILRFSIHNNTDLGQLAKTFMEKGELMPDGITTEILKNHINLEKPSKGFVFDGFPRTLSQAKSLDDFLKEKDTLIHGLIYLKVSDEILVKRLLLRGESSGRKDDRNEEIIRTRIREYYNKTNSLIDFYRDKGVLFQIDGEREIDMITDSTIQLVNSIRKF